MGDYERALDEVRRILMQTWPGRFQPESLVEDQELGENGLGLDSIEIVETLLALQETRPAPLSEDLLTAGPISLRRVAEYFATA